MKALGIVAAIAATMFAGLAPAAAGVTAESDVLPDQIKKPSARRISGGRRSSSRTA